MPVLSRDTPITHNSLSYTWGMGELIDLSVRSQTIIGGRGSQQALACCWFHLCPPHVDFSYFTVLYAEKHASFIIIILHF